MNVVKHLAMDAASWWITWVLFGLVAWAGLGFLLLCAFGRFCRWQSRQPIPYMLTEAADDALGYDSTRAMLDGPVWRPEDMDILAGRKLP
jgi:hypothetical protein